MARKRETAAPSGEVPRTTTRQKDIQYYRTHIRPTGADSNAWHFADGCEHRDRQTIALLRMMADHCRKRGELLTAEAFELAIDIIERGDHAKS